MSWCSAMRLATKLRLQTAQLMQPEAAAAAAAAEAAEPSAPASARNGTWLVSATLAACRPALQASQ